MAKFDAKLATAQLELLYTCIRTRRLKVVTNEKGEAVGEVLTILC